VGGTFTDFYELALALGQSMHLFILLMISHMKSCASCPEQNDRRESPGQTANRMQM
jgi:hypothetical protein